MLLVWHWQGFFKTTDTRNSWKWSAQSWELVTIRDFSLIFHYCIEFPCILYKKYVRWAVVFLDSLSVSNYGRYRSIFQWFGNLALVKCRIIEFKKVVHSTKWLLSSKLTKSQLFKLSSIMSRHSKQLITVPAVSTTHTHSLQELRNTRDLQCLLTHY